MQYFQISFSRFLFVPSELLFLFEFSSLQTKKIYFIRIQYHRIEVSKCCNILRSVSEIYTYFGIRNANRPITIPIRSASLLNKIKR